MGVVVFVMAVQPFTQMIWGKPKITVDFSASNVDSGRILECRVYNPPITTGVLRLLGTTRMTSEDIMADFSIKEDGSGRVVFPGAVAQIQTFAGSYAQRVRLLGSVFLVVFSIATCVKNECKVNPFGEHSQTTPSPGLYCACVHVVVGGKAITKQRNFVVTEEYPFAYWDVNS